jgi:protein-S-isoprenylcysteine O-methyltransferase Ste14
MKTYLKAMSWALIGLVVLCALLFWPEGTFNYWQAWVFIALFMLATIVPSVYLGRTDPAALQRRMHAGPPAETRAVQKIIIVGAFLGLFTMMALSAFDHRFGWLPVPAAVCVTGDVLIVAGLYIGMLVVTQNSYAAATVTVEAEQKLASGGLYKVVRQPMYAGSLILMLGIPLALGSYWGLLLIIPGLLVLVFRILDEEALLSQELAGYREYKQRVHFRLVPYVW